MNLQTHSTALKRGIQVGRPFAGTTAQVHYRSHSSEARCGLNTQLCFQVKEEPRTRSSARVGTASTSHAAFIEPSEPSEADSDDDYTANEEIGESSNDTKDDFPQSPRAGAESKGAAERVDQGTRGRKRDAPSQLRVRQLKPRKNLASSGYKGVYEKASTKCASCLFSCRICPSCFHTFSPQLLQ